MKPIFLRQCINRIPGFIFILVLLIQPGKFNAQCLEDFSASGPSSSSGDPCNKYFHEESATFYPEGIIYLNFHFIRDEDGERNFDENGDNNSNPNDGNYSGIRIANEILKKLNIITRDAMLLDPVLPGVNGNVPSPNKLPWRYELYTESTEPSDSYDGIWFWDNPNYDLDLAQTDHGMINFNYKI